MLERRKRAESGAEVIKRKVTSEVPPSAETNGRAFPKSVIAAVSVISNVRLGRIESCCFLVDVIFVRILGSLIRASRRG